MRIYDYRHPGPPLRRIACRGTGQYVFHLAFWHDGSRLAVMMGSAVVVFGTEYELIDHLHSVVPTDIAITVLADRGFGDQKLYERLETLEWDFVIRCRENILVESAEGEQRPASEWVPKNGRVRKLDGAYVNEDRAEVPSVVLKKAAKMKEAWCLATSLREQTGQGIVDLYSKRFTIEGRSATRRTSTSGWGCRRHLAGSRCRMSRVDQDPEREEYEAVALALSEGRYWYDVLPDTRDEWGEHLMAAYEVVLQEHKDLVEVLQIL